MTLLWYNKSIKNKKKAKTKRRLIDILLLSLSLIILFTCSENNQQSLDGEYYWINENRNERVFTISGNKGNNRY